MLYSLLAVVSMIFSTVPRPLVSLLLEEIQHKHQSFLPGNIYNQLINQSNRLI